MAALISGGKPSGTGNQQVSELVPYRNLPRCGSK